MVSLREIRDALGRHEPHTFPRRGRAEAGVALVLREIRGGPELLFIERAEREGDPWSGHMAFPGGGRDPGDRDVEQAAERETLEEVGIPLAGHPPLGRLDDLEGRHAGRTLPLVISAFAYAVEHDSPLVLNHEVRDALWVPVRELLDPGRHTHYTYELGEHTLSFPGIQLGDAHRHVVWGLTYRFLESFFRVLGTPLDDRW